MFKGKTKYGVDIRSTQAMPAPAPSIQWYVVADSHTAKIYWAHGSRLRLVKKMFNSRARGKDSLQYSDRHGRVFESRTARVPSGIQLSSGSHSYASEETPREHNARLFAKKVSEYLDKARISERFHSCVLIADPGFMGNLRAQLPLAVSRLTKKTIDKHYIGLATSDLEKRLLVNT